MVIKKVNKSDFSDRLTNWIGTKSSIKIHTIFFIGIFGLQFLGFTTDQVLLILTTFLSVEAIYLAIFIQMTVNRQSEDIEEIQEDAEEEDINDREVKKTLQTIEKRLNRLQKDLDVLKKKGLL